mmetsp:Transcript_3515/g.7635  ORF Transcript_3515/g.7635 Transcript_3515/m.7635 type:complete len:432 (+) Transcript_3515:1533-2828(+)
MDSLRKASPSVFGYLIKTEWKGFYYPPTPLPSTVPSPAPSRMPSVSHSLSPSSSPTYVPSSIPTSNPTSHPSLAPTSTSPTDMPSASPSFVPSNTPVTIEIQGNPFDVSLRRMSTYMGTTSLARLSDALDEMTRDNMNALDPNVSIKFSSKLLSQSLGSTSLQVRMQRTALVTVPGVGEPGEYDKNRVPGQRDIEAAVILVLTSPYRKQTFIEKLQEPPLISQYRYLTDISFLGFVYLPTSMPTGMPIVPDIEVMENATTIDTISMESEVSDSEDSIVSLTWSLSQSGQDADGGWVVSEDGLHLRFNVEDSDLCYEGTNRNTQKGKAVTTIEVTEETKLAYVLGGEGESLDSGYEKLSLTIDRHLVASSTSRAIGVECSSNPVLVAYYEASPYILTPGTHVLVVDFSTADDFDHYGTYWTIDISFSGITTP